MIFSLLIYWELIGAGWATAAAVTDFVLVGAAGGAVMEAVQSQDSPEDAAKVIRTICNRALWTKRRALQMLQEADLLDKEAALLKMKTEAYLQIIAETTGFMKSELEKGARVYKVRLVLGILGVIVVCCVFLLLALEKGGKLRAALDALRRHESLK